MGSSTCRALIVIAAVMAGGSACESAVEPEERGRMPDVRTGPVPDLEAIPFEALGTGGIAFHRIPPAGPWGLMVVEVDARRATGHLGGTILLEPTLRPGGELVAFRIWTPADPALIEQTHRDVYVARLDGTAVTQLSNAPGGVETSPVWTHDGSRLLFAVHRSNRVEIQSVDPARPDEDPSVLHESGDLPGIARIAVSVDGVVAHAGSSADGIRTIEAGEATLVHPAPPGSGVTAPAWSPDGTRLAFIEFDRGEEGSYERMRVVVREIGTGEPEVVTRFDDRVVRLGLLVHDFSLCWSRDGSTLVFTRPTTPADSGPQMEPASHVYAVAAAGGEAVRVTSAESVVDHHVSCW